MRLAIMYLLPRGSAKGVGSEEKIRPPRRVGPLDKIRYPSASTTSPPRSSGSASAARTLLTWSDTERHLSIQTKPLFHHSHARGPWFESRCVHQIIRSVKRSGWRSVAG